MKKVFGLCVAVSMAVGCGGSTANFSNAVPSSDNVKLNVPNSGSAALKAGQTQQAVQGQTASMYALTVGVTGVVNLGTVFVLGLVRDITQQAPTTSSGNSATWGPYTGQLSPTTWKLTAEKTGAHTYSYSLEGKPKAADDSAYVIVLSGTHTPALDASGNNEKDFGSGTFLVDWDEAAKLPGHGNDVGTAAFTYSRASADAQASIDVDFHQVRDANSGNLIDATYHWDETPAVGGDFSFATMGDVDHDAAATLENLAIQSRWMANGAGRSDVTATGGSVGSANLSECWNESFASTFLSASWDSTQDYGNEGTDCVFTSAAFPQG